jgi:hypothetical protein
MPEPDNVEPLESPPYTAWHPMLIALIERFLPKGYKLFPEFLLSRLAQRADVLVVRLLEIEAGPVEKIHSILDYLRDHTLIEYKGPTDDLAGEDVLALLGYGYQYMRLAKVTDPADVCLMVVADRIPQSFLDQAKRCGVELAEAERGIWRGHFAGFVVHGVETGKAAERGPTEHLLYTFSRAFLQRPMQVPPLDPEDARVYVWLYQQVQQFKRARGAMAVKDVDTFERSMMEMFESLAAEHPELIDRILARCPPEKRLQGFESLAAEHPELIDRILARCPPEKRLQGLAPEDRLQGLAPEDRLQGLAPEDRLQGLAPEDRLRGLSPEDLEQLKRLLH